MFPNAPVPLTSKGDLLTFSSTSARLGVGSDTQVLTADSTQTDGIKWTAAAGGGITPVLVIANGSGSADYTTTSTSIVDISADLNTTIAAATGDNLMALLQGVMTTNAASFRLTFNIGGTDVGDTDGLIDATNPAGDAPISMVYAWTASAGQISGGTIAVHPRWFASAATTIELRNLATVVRPRLVIWNFKH